MDGSLYPVQRIMRGNAPTLKDIILYDLPTCDPTTCDTPPVDLYCYEQFDTSDEDDEDDDQPIKQDIQRYRIVCGCTQCGRSVKLVVSSTGADIQQLHQMLQDTLGIVCPLCACVE